MGPTGGEGITREQQEIKGIATEGLLFGHTGVARLEGGLQNGGQGDGRADSQLGGRLKDNGARQ